MNHRPCENTTNSLQFRSRNCSVAGTSLRVDRQLVTYKVAEKSSRIYVVVPDFFQRSPSFSEENCRTVIGGKYRQTSSTILIRSSKILEKLPDFFNDLLSELDLGRKVRQRSSFWELGMVTEKAAELLQRIIFSEFDGKSNC